MSVIKLVIADDHAIFREGLKQLLEDAGDIQVVAEARNGIEATQVGLKTDYDVMLLDISLPDRNGIDVLKMVRETHKKRPIIMLSMHREDQYAFRCFTAGASGYVSKQCASDELLGAIRLVHKGKKYISPEVAQVLAEHVDDTADALLHASLSTREFQTLVMIGSGMTVGLISEKLSLSVKTISVYRARILEKMHFKNNADIMSYVIKNHLIES